MLGSKEMVGCRIAQFGSMQKHLLAAMKLATVKTALGTVRTNAIRAREQDETADSRTGQGSGASPAVWLTLVVVLMNTLDRITRGKDPLLLPDAPDRHQRLTDAFVNDTASLAITDTYDPMTPNSMIRSIEKSLRTGNGCYFLFWGLPEP
jgi:hypothetical protein